MLIDSHCHLQTFAKRGDLEEILNEASLAGVNRMITVGTSTEDWGLYRDLAIKYPGKIYYSVGLHPCDVNENWQQQIEELQKQLSTGDSVQPVALGEIGLDYFHLPKEEEARAKTIELQKAAFRAQLEMVKGTDLPIIIHSRNSMDDCIKILDTDRANWDKIVFHCFSEGRSEMDRINLRGGRGSFTGIVTYNNSGARPLRDAMYEQGAERLMIETDCPYLTPEPLRRQENHPAYLKHTLQAAASILQVPVTELELQITENTVNFFGLES